ncbi:MAG: tetratricopeptide repeat protein [Kofleriaceae bacterium]
MKRRPSTLAVIATLLVVSVGPTWAQAPTGRPTKPDAITHFQQGNAHYRVREFEDAAKEYKLGEQIEPAAIFDYNLGQCYRQLTKYQDAIWHYDRYLRSGVASQQETDAINSWITQMKAELEQRAKSEPPTEPATMQPQPQPQPQPPASSPSSMQRQLAPLDPWYADYFGWALAGSGLVLSGVGVGLLLDASSLRDDADMTANQMERNDLRQKADSRSLAGGIFAIGGGALLLTGIVKLVVHDHAPASSDRIGIGMTTNELIVFGRF